MCGAQATFIAQNAVRSAYIKADDVGTLGVCPCHLDGILNDFRPTVCKDVAVKALGNNPAQSVQ